MVHAEGVGSYVRRALRHQLRGKKAGSLRLALLWSAAAVALYRLVRPRAPRGAALVVGAAVFSHWVLDFLVHRPDLPLYDDSAKVGMGLWNFPVIALALEVTFLFGGLWLYFQTGVTRRTGVITFAVLMVAIQVFVFFGPPPASDRAAAMTALAAYAVFASVIALLERRNNAPAPQ